MGRKAPGRRPNWDALLVAAIAAALALPASARATDPSLVLAERYAPVVRLVEQNEPCKHGEPFVPTSVNLVLGNPDVSFRGPWDKTNIIKVAPTAQDLSGGLFGYHLDFPGSAVAPSPTYDEWSHRINKGHPPTMYARVDKRAGRAGWRCSTGSFTSSTTSTTSTRATGR